MPGPRSISRQRPRTRGSGGGSTSGKPALPVAAPSAAGPWAAASALLARPPASLHGRTTTASWCARAASNPAAGARSKSSWGEHFRHSTALLKESNLQSRNPLIYTHITVSEPRQLGWQRRATKRGAKLQKRPKKNEPSKAKTEEPLPALSDLTGLAGPFSFRPVPEDAEASLSAAALRQLLAERLLPTEGKKAALVERFAAHRAFHDEGGFDPVFFGADASAAAGSPTKEAEEPWPRELPRAKSFASIQCWRSRETIHAWVQQDPKRWRYGRLSGRVGKAEGEDFDFEAPDEKEKTPAPSPMKPAEEAKAAEEAVATPQRKRRRVASPVSSVKRARPRARKKTESATWATGKFAQLSASGALDLCLPEPAAKPAVDLDEDSEGGGPELTFENPQVKQTPQTPQLATERGLLDFRQVQASRV